MLTWCAWKAALQQVLGIPHLLNADGQMAGNSLINTKYIQGAACKIWVTEISSDSCWNDGCLAGNSLINGTYILGAACEVWVTQISSNSCQNDGWMAGNTPINGTYIPGAAYLIHAGMVSMESHCWGVLGMLHLLNVDWQMAGNCLINAKYTKGTACEVWVTQISSDPCQNGVHGKPLLSRCPGCSIHSIQMGRWLAIV
ncbi:hypothetical protein BKA82DRAFT_4019826 [Pisolithus tinctorius]|nr:hypothetical protein BKA82DRAFT_4019826 [Pisolithus tinctorius]